ncbi:MAG: MBL fold metallo-hydrolase, partial [Thermoanaerobaculia bacterium]|nr:MBL fold metallo-hydrolase [Thermoanaerobaculia bacterium]
MSGGSEPFSGWGRRRSMPVRRLVASALAGAILGATGCTVEEPATGAGEAREAPTAATGDAGPESAPSPGNGGEPVTVTILATNGADLLGGPTPLQGEWSFAAWVEVGDRAFLFDTGWSPRNVLHNAEVLGIDLSRAEDLVLSHNHGDHTGGLETLRRELSARNPKALARIHIAEGIFASRPGPDGGERNPMVAARARLEALGSTFVAHSGPAEIAPGVWVTGPVPRVHPETNYPTGPEMVVV